MLHYVLRECVEIDINVVQILNMQIFFSDFFPSGFNHSIKTLETTFPFEL